MPSPSTSTTPSPSSSFPPSAYFSNNINPASSNTVDPKLIKFLQNIQVLSLCSWRYISHLQKIVQSDLPPSHPIHLGLTLNLSVFYYDNLNTPNKACVIAKQAFNNDLTLIMQLLGDNPTLWTSDQAGSDGADKGDAGGE
eukprot:jgi/Psemu1/41526/gm1.41526_g